MVNTVIATNPNGICDSYTNFNSSVEVYKCGHNVNDKLPLSITSSILSNGLYHVLVNYSAVRRWGPGINNYLREAIASSIGSWVIQIMNDGYNNVTQVISSQATKTGTATVAVGMTLNGNNSLTITFPIPETAYNLNSTISENPPTNTAYVWYIGSYQIIRIGSGV
jgi:hypothetical protein